MARPQAVTVTTSPRSRRVDDRCYRHLVSHVRTGVVAITRSGQLAVMNDIAARSK
jgi:hypothetical protein